MEARRGSSAAGGRQPRVEDEEQSDAATPTVAIGGMDADDRRYSGPVPGGRPPRSQSRSTSISSPRWNGGRYHPEEENSDNSGCSESQTPRLISFREYSPERIRDHSQSSASEGDLPSPDEWDLHDIDDEGEWRSPEEALPQEWTQPRTVLEDSTATELIVAQSIERRISKSGSEKIVLVSPSRPPPLAGFTGQNADKSRAHFRWLHVQCNASRGSVEDAFQTFERFVLNCPFIAEGIREHALRFLSGRARKQIGPSEGVTSASVRLALATGQVQFISMEATGVLCFGTLGEDRSYAQPLLRAFRGYDVGNERELSQVARKMGVGGGHDVLHVAALWCLTLGPGVMITICCLPSTDLCGDLIQVDDRANRGFYTIQVKLHDSEFCCNTVVDPECNYRDFLRHAVAVATSGTRMQDATKYDLFYEAQASEDSQGLKQLQLLTPLRWLKLLDFDGIEDITFHLKPKFRARSRSRRPYHRQPPPTTSRRRSYRESPVRCRTPLMAPTRDWYSAVPGREREGSKALVVWEGDQSAISTVDVETGPEPAVLRDTHEYHRGLESSQPQPIRIVSRDGWRDSHRIPTRRDYKGHRQGKAGRGTTDAYSSDDHSPMMERARVKMARKTRTSSTDSGHPIHQQRGRSQWPKRPGSDAAVTNPPDAERETPPPNTFDAVTAAPFFTWHIKSNKHAVDNNQNKDTSSASDTAIRDLFYILGKIHQSLLSTELGIPEVYLRAYKCTEANLLKRHPDLASPTAAAGSNCSPSAHGGGVAQGEKNAGERKGGLTEDRTPRQPAASPPDSTWQNDVSQGKETVRQENNGPSYPSGKKQDPATPTVAQVGAQGQAGHSNSVKMMHPAGVYGKQLLEISQEIIRRYLPQDENSTYHPVYERFWGSVDEAIRQIRWSAEQPDGWWRIRDFDTLSGTGNEGVTVKKSFAGCRACCSPSMNYPSASEALQHLHTVHFECPLGESAVGRTKDKPHDDPCYAYIKSLAPAHSIEAGIEEIAKEFIDHISDFSGNLSKIQWLVATNSQDKAQRHRRRLNPHRPPTRAALQPQLPRPLVDAFDDIVAYYVLQAKRLSIMNRAIGLSRCDGIRENEIAQALDRTEKLARRCRDIRVRVLSCLQKARRDVLLSRTGHGATSEDDADTTLGIQAFDTTSFMRTFTRSALEITFSAPLVEKKTAGDARFESKREQSGAPDPSWDVLRVYSEYSKQLHMAATRRPRRRLFLDIHALEDELEALEAHLDYSLHWMRWTLQQFPRPDTINEDGKRLKTPGYPGWERQYRDKRTMEAERHHIFGRRDAVQAKLAEVQKLQESAIALRERVRQMIEITDEDHGKAIRVFTIVTVVFLPLTFVSGFLGMNTVDIRDIEANQSLYWSIAIPVTFVVLAVAFIYGYKGDDIDDWIHDRIHLWKVPRFPRPAEVLDTRKPLLPTTDGRRGNWAGAVRNSIRRRKRWTDQDKTRTSTFHSDALS